jgi:hypothetical protein
MAVTAIDLQVDDLTATALLSRAYGWRMLTDDVPAAVEKAVEAGAELLTGPLRTDWGTEAAYLKGPGGLIVDVCRDTQQA